MCSVRTQKHAIDIRRFPKFPNQVFGSFVVPVSLHLSCPTSIPFPGIERRINSGSSSVGSRCFRNPAAIVLPAVIICVCLETCLTIISCDLLCRLIAVVAGPRGVLTILHVTVLVLSINEILRIRSPRSQELDHRAACDCSHNKQRIERNFNLMYGSRCQETTRMNASIYSK